MSYVDNHYRAPTKPSAGELETEAEWWVALGWASAEARRARGAHGGRDQARPMAAQAGGGVQGSGLPEAGRGQGSEGGRAVMLKVNIDGIRAAQDAGMFDDYPEDQLEDLGFDMLESGQRCWIKVQGGGFFDVAVLDESDWVVEWKDKYMRVADDQQDNHDRKNNINKGSAMICGPRNVADFAERALAPWNDPGHPNRMRPGSQYPRRPRLKGRQETKAARAVRCRDSHSLL